MKKIFILSVTALAQLSLTACETTNSMPYQSSSTNVMKIQESTERSNTQVKLADFTMSEEVKDNLGCRLLGPVNVTPGKSIPEYIQEAFQEELFRAGVYATDANVEIDGHITELNFSSVSQAFWKIGLKLTPSNGEPFTVNTYYEFSTSYSAYSACQNVADAFGPSVQELIETAVTDPAFRQVFEN